MLALLFAATVLSAGQPAPPVTVEELLQAPADAAVKWPA
jgi:hypothetical protein